MAYDSTRGVTVLFGGDDDGILSNDTWAWDGANWTQASPTDSPPGRSGHAMVYDSTRGVTVLFGGWGGAVGVLGDTWEWDGTNWTWAARANNGTPTGPSAREYESMAFDSARGVTVLFGGDLGSGEAILNDTWEWNGTTWTAASPVGSPSARTGLAMAYDSTRSVTVLFGGMTMWCGHPACTMVNDTWQWDGITWTQWTPNGARAGPPARFGHALAFDSTSGVTVLFGGTGAGEGPSGLLDDTWAWDGMTWTEVSSAVANPSARYQHAMAFDSNRAVTVLFGGENSSGNSFADTWEWTGSP